MQFESYDNNENTIFSMTFWRITTVYGVGFICLRAISFLLLPFYTNLLSKHDVGWVFIIYTILAFLNVLYTHGMNAALFKFFHSSKKKEIITTSNLYSVFYSVGLSLFLFLGYVLYISITNNIPSYDIVIIILVIASLDMVSSRNSSLLRLLERPYYYLFVCFINVVLSIAFNIYFIQICHLGLLGAINALLYVSIIQFLLLLPIMFSYFSITCFNKELLYKMLRFGIAFFPAALFFVLIEMSDRWMLGYLRNINDVGLYGAGYKIGSVVLLLVNSFNLNWQPFYLKRGLDKGVAVFENIGQHFLLILIFIATILSILWPIIFQWRFGSFYLIGMAFWKGGNIIPIICLSYIFYGLFILQMPSIYLKTKQNWAPIFWGSGFFINMLANCLLIPRFGIYGAAYATLLAYFTMSMMLIYKNQSWLPIKYQCNKLIPFIMLSATTYLGTQLLFLQKHILFIVALYIMGSLCYIYYTSKNIILKLD